MFSRGEKIFLGVVWEVRQMLPGQKTYLKLSGEKIESYIHILPEVSQNFLLPVNLLKDTPGHYTLDVELVINNKSADTMDILFEIVEKGQGEVRFEMLELKLFDKNGVERQKFKIGDDILVKCIWRVDAVPQGTSQTVEFLFDKDGEDRKVEDDEPAEPEKIYTGTLNFKAQLEGPSVADKILTARVTVGNVSKERTIKYQILK